MLQQYYGEPEPNAEQPQSLKPEAQSKTPDYRFAVFVLQTAVCAVILAICLILKFLAADVYAELSGFYRNCIAGNANINQVLQPAQKPQNSSESSAGGVGGPVEETGALTEFCLPVQGTVTSAFGYRVDPFTGKYSLHGGYDIGAPAGTPITAATGGIVDTAEENASGYGNYIVITNGQVQTLYGHLLKLGVTKGQRVTKGQQIGLCGSTGRSTGPHLHFELKVNGIRIDPAPFILKT